MLKTQRKTGFLGFLVSIKSVEEIFDKWIVSQKSLRYLLTYKLGQDHLELFFSAIRSCGGFNNNPTAAQFTSAYKRLLMRSHIENVKGNCSPQDSTQLLNILDDSCYVRGRYLSVTDEDSLIGKYDLSGETESQTVDDSIPFFPARIIPSEYQETKLSKYQETIVQYVAGYAVRMVRREIRCSECSNVS